MDGINKDYSAWLAEEVCAQFVVDTGKYRFGNGDNGLCRFNDSVNCSDGICGKCGWNPSVSRRRINRIRNERLQREALTRY